MNPIRVVIGKVGLDGHDRGAKVVARAFRDAGMEVIYTGIRRTPEELAMIVLQEDAEVLGLSVLAGAVLPLSKRVIEAMRQYGVPMDEVVLLVGGIISATVAEQLKATGVDGAFGPGTSLPQVIEFVKEQVSRKREAGLTGGES